VRDLEGWKRSPIRDLGVGEESLDNMCLSASEV
jgi:hypothetical protein